MRLIDADALLDGREDHEMISTHLIWNAPTVDAVEVVRCKDCKYMGEVSLTHNGDYVVNSCGYHNSFVIKNDYCSRAERRTS